MEMVNIPDILQNRRVLIVEDNMLVALVVEAMLQDAGCTTAVVPGSTPPLMRRKKR